MAEATEPAATIRELKEAALLTNVVVALRLSGGTAAAMAALDASQCLVPAPRARPEAAAVRVDR